MSLKSERLKQYTNYKSGLEITTIEPLENKRVATNFMTANPKQGNRFLIVQFLKNAICFTGVWLVPLFHLSGLTIQKYWGLYAVALTAISFGNLNLFMVGKKEFGIGDTFTILSLTDSIWKYEEEQQKNPPLVKELSFAGDGVYFGTKNGIDVGKNVNTDGHIIVFGGSGSGKSSCIAIPTLNRYKQGVFAIDIKDGGELERKSKKNGTSHTFRPGTSNSIGYDPFWFLDSTKPENGLKEIVYALIPTDSKNPSDFWVMNEQRYLLAALYYCYDMEQSFVESCRTIYALSTKELLERIAQSDCRFAKEGMSDYYGMAEETLGGIVGGVGNAISTFVTDQDILSVLSKSVIMTPELLLKGERIFICIPEHKLDVYRELLQLIITQFLRYFEQLKDEQTRPVLFMLDEFARLGRYDRLINGLATLRSKKVTIMILTQSISQLDAIYGNDNRKVMTDNCAYKLVLNASDADSQQYFSKLAGTYIKHQKSYTRGKSSSYSISEHELPIIKPEEFATLSKALLISPFGIQWINKQPYYKK